MSLNAPEPRARSLGNAQRPELVRQRGMCGVLSSPPLQRLAIHLYRRGDGRWGWRLGPEPLSPRHSQRFQPLPSGSAPNGRQGCYTRRLPEQADSPPPGHLVSMSPRGTA
jgi:hypothetical protein